MRKLLVGLIVLGFMAACSSPQKTDTPVGTPPALNEKRSPVDSTDEDVKPKKKTEFSTAPDRTPVR